MKIAVDIDEVLFKFMEGYLNFLRNTKFYNFSFNEVTDYHIWNTFNISKDEVLRFADEFYFSNSFNKDRVVEGSRDRIYNLRNEDLFFITNRLMLWAEKTYSFIRENFNICVPKIFFSGNLHTSQEKSKEEYCKDLDIGCIIEDQTENSIRCARNGLDVLLINKPWNTNCSHDNIFRCSDWKDVLLKINGNKNGK